MRLIAHIILVLLLLSAFPACKKTGGPVIRAERIDFTGTWKGELVSYTYGRKIVQKYEWVVYTNPVDGRLSGLLTMYETNRLEELQFSDGAWYFRVINSDSLNPQCREWSFAGYAKFTGEGMVEFNLAGNKCGPIGDQYTSWGGTMSKVSDSLDPGAYFSFIREGRAWTYKITKNNNDTCALHYQVDTREEEGLFKGAISNFCDWSWQEKHFSWTVDPCRFTVLPDTLNKISLSVFTLDMTAEKIYQFRDGTDVSITALIKRNEQVSVPAGKFLCNKYQVETLSEEDMPATGIVSYYWISNRYGIIKREVLNPADSTSLKLQVLTSKNF